MKERYPLLFSTKEVTVVVKRTKKVHLVKLNVVNWNQVEFNENYFGCFYIGDVL